MSFSLLSATPGFASSLAGSVRALGARLTASRDRARIVRELETLTSRELSDLGIGTADFHAIAAGTYVDRRQPERRPEPTPAPATAAEPHSCVVLYLNSHARRRPARP